MTWTKLDDHFRDHPKILKAGPLASWLHVCALNYSGDHMTDGFIAAEIVGTLARFEDIATRSFEDRLVDTWEPVDVPELVTRLVDAKLWSPVDGGYAIHDFLEHNPSREEALSQRPSWRQQSTNGRRGGRRRAESADRDGGGRFLPSGGSPDGSPAVTSAGAGPVAGPTGETAGQPRGPDPEPEPEPGVGSEISTSTNRGGGAEGGSARLDVEGRLGDDAGYLLRRLADRRRSWRFLLEDQGELETVGRLTDEFNGAVTRALQQASDDPTKIRRPLAWLQTVVPRIAGEATATSTEGVNH